MPDTTHRRGRPVDTEAGAERRRRLCEAAVAVALRDSVAALSLRSVAAEAGLSAAMISYEFENKDGLLLAMLQCMHQQVRAALAASASPRPGLGHALAHFAEAFWAHVRETPGLQRVQFELTLHALTLPGGQALAQAQYEGYVQAAADALAVAALQPLPERWLRDLAGTCVAIMDGVILQWLATGDAAAAHRQLQRAVRALQASLVPAP